ncbi:hypothetical protein F5B21DRAFT_496127 [Xylaria acuta]|nr:hypothetical protein F5B21DRAFT_496127 [Xylaria acuta]
MSAANAHSPHLTASSKAPDGATQTATKNSQSPDAATRTAAPKPQASPITPAPPRKADTTMPWGAPAGLSIRSNNDENLLVFRKALGINMHRDTSDTSGTLEEGRKTAIGIYRTVIETQTRMIIQHALLKAFLYLVYFAQIIIGAALTALGATAARHQTVITILGAFNTVLAGVLALIKGSGQPEKLGKDRIGYRRLQDWVEETEALLAVGVIGRNRREVGLLVESAFKRYHAAKASEENNDPDFYVHHPQEPLGNRASDDGNGHEAAKAGNGD